MLELATMGGSALLGFIFKMMANSQADKAEQNRMLLQKAGIENSNANEAGKRAGVWMQRFTVLVLISLFAYISIGTPDGMTNIIQTNEPTSLLFGLLQFDNPDTIRQVSGMLYTETLQLSVLNILSYLFGSQVAERR